MNPINSNVGDDGERRVRDEGTKPATDPVCGMSLSRRGAAFEDHEGERHFFCSEECRRRFIAEPDRYSVSCLEVK